MARACKARQPDGVYRCELEWGHMGEHQVLVFADHDPEASELIQWPSARQDRQVRRGRTSRLRDRTEAQAYRQGRLAGIRDERLAKQAQAYSQRVQGLRFPDEVPGSSWCEHCRKPTPPDRLQLHHYVHRSIGRRATPVDQGDERPEELGLICQGPGSCHAAEHD